ncbi:Thymidylate kinase [Schistosoma japonicum]|uniref:dTMP kinase n=2 Tax=Schistosoma japonicum TaxID=6182 RepID=B3GUS7_SCHJA|nr:Thymidylate kinase [Schistosoma japonicum]KAH8859258.1 Thymidylate kinase [Schistosoma japonicum]TNN12557.1 Thymidylate kinase [Schistosoma japonicum]TNN12558.1 Thymidylate kinase [Schistosoma japonicum]TNN12559.1 Thymidylate kinase [Schistosoma japonicum]
MPGTIKRGLFVVFEGVEKCGKNTQSELLQDALTQITGKQALLIHFPDKSTPVGKLLAEYFDGKLQLELHASHLLHIANRWERQDEISNALKAGISVVVDRYSYSGIAYTAAKFHPLSDADWKWCRSVEYGLLQPDFIFCLAPENFAEISVRDSSGGNKFETMDFQKRVLTYFGRLSREMESELNENNGDDNAESEPRLWHWIPATGQTVDEIHSCIMAIIDSKL